MEQIKKVIIPVAGSGTRFLPLSKVLPKEFWPLVDKPMIQYIIEEAKASGIEQIIFVVKPGDKWITEYFKRNAPLEKLLRLSKKEKLMEELAKISEVAQGINFSFVSQEKAIGDGHAILQARRKVGKEPCGVMWSDDIVDAKSPCLAQLISVFKTCQQPIVALKKMPQESLGKYGVVQVEKIASRLYKIKKVVEKPDPVAAPSDLVVVGKYIITPEVFGYLSKAEPAFRGEIILAETLNKMVMEGKMVYGYEFEGEWLECGTKENWLKSNLYLAQKNQEYGKEIKQYLEKFK